MKGLIIYCSVYGTTEQYAEWIGTEVSLKKNNYKMISESDIKNCDFLVIGSFVLAHKLAISRWLRKKQELLKEKQLFIFSVSGAKPGSKELDTVFSDSLPQPLLMKSKTYQFGGKMRYEDLTGFHKLMMKIGTFIEKDPKVKADMKRDMKVAKNNVDIKFIEPLVNDLKEYMK